MPPTLVFAKEFLDDYAKLERPVRQQVRELPGKFEHSTSTGVHLEKLTDARDDRVRTVRVDQFWRGVVVRLGQARTPFCVSSPTTQPTTGPHASSLG